MQRLLTHSYLRALLLGFALLSLSSVALAQYTLANLDSNQTGKAKHTDPLLVNGWGLAYQPGNPFWVSDEGTGWSTLYDGTGNPQSLQVVIPGANGGQGSPTGMVYNGSQEFKIRNWTSAFLFATLDGTISGWSSFSPTLALIGVNNSASHASYTGLAITNKTSGNFIYATDINNNKVDVYDGTFKFVTSFTDTALPAGWAPFGIQDINGQLYVAFAPTSGAPGGLIDIFNEDGTFVKHFAHGNPLNQPWGFAVAPSNFGPLSNTLLISNNTDTGTINGFDLTTGKFVGTVKDASGRPIVIDQLWAIEFGGGSPSNGKTNQLFFTAGPNNNFDGTFGVILIK